MDELEAVGDDIRQLRTHRRDRSAEVFANGWPRSEDGTGGRRLRERPRLHGWAAGRAGGREGTC
jgi:hypothetical protein